MFNIGCGVATSIRELWGRIADLVGVDLEPQYGEPRAGDVRYSLASITRAREQLGYVPSVNIDEGLRQTIAYFRERVQAPERLRVAI